MRAAFSSARDARRETRRRRTTTDDVNVNDRYKSEPQAPPPRKGEVAKIVASDFYKRVVLQRNVDALIYFSVSDESRRISRGVRTNARAHRGSARRLRRSTRRSAQRGDERGASAVRGHGHDALRSVVQGEQEGKSEVHPAQHAKGEYITGESAPTLADVLVMVSKHAKSKKTKQEADKALVDAPLEKLHSTRTSVRAHRTLKMRGKI